MLLLNQQEHQEKQAHRTSLALSRTSKPYKDHRTTFSLRLMKPLCMNGKACLEVSVFLFIRNFTELLFIHMSFMVLRKGNCDFMSLPES